MRELVVVARPGASVDGELEGTKSRMSTGTLHRILRGMGDGGEREFHIAVAPDEELEALQIELLSDPDVLAAYIKEDAPPPLPPGSVCSHSISKPAGAALK